jgi:hypothetical protein
MISDKEWLRTIGNWRDWEDESYGERLLKEYMRIHKRGIAKERKEAFEKILKRTIKSNKDLLKELEKL